MEIRNIKTFLYVVETGNFSKAAESLGYSQSTVSIHIGQIEEELGCQLFDRIGHNVYLTSRGKLFLNHAINVNNSLEEMKEDFLREESPSGEIRFASSDSLLEKIMLESYPKFIKTYPFIKLIFSTGSTTSLLEQLDRNEADVIFTLDSPVHRNDLVIEGEAPVKLCFVASPKLELCEKGSISIKDILDYPLLLTESGLSYRKIFEDYLLEEALAINPILETGRTDIIIKCLEKGVGISFLPEFTIDKEIKRKKLVELKVKDFDLTINKQLIYRKDKWQSKVFKSFVEFVVQQEFDGK